MSASAHAGVEVGGTAGVHVFSEHNALGTKDNDVVSHANSAVFSFRFGLYFNAMLGVEAEVGLIPTESRGGNVTFDIYDGFARGNLIAQFRSESGSNVLIPFVTLGGGAMRVMDIGTNDASLLKEGATDPFGFVGIGAKYRAGGGWGVRADFRVNLVPSNSGSVTTDFEGLASLYREWGRPAAAAKIEEKKDETPTETADADGDGILDADKCPNEAEDMDGFQDEDGCPDPDNDNDGIADAADKCAAEPEDKDNFQDDDGCPDPDNDNDGVPDAADKCADQAETRNGFEDEDGCADEIPAALQKSVGVVTGVTFKVNSADLLPASNKALDALAATLAQFPGVKVEIGAHTDDQPLKAGGAFADNDALSQARAESVKAYLVKKGVAEDQIVAKGYGATKPAQDPTDLKGGKLAAARKANQRVELQIVMPEAAPAPAAAE
jgi:OOP family OmpA-OmpF porin